MPTVYRIVINDRIGETSTTAIDPEMGQVEEGGCTAQMGRLVDQSRLLGIINVADD